MPYLPAIPKPKGQLAEAQVSQCHTAVASSSVWLSTQCVLPNSIIFYVYLLLLLLSRFSCVRLCVTP